MPNQSKEALSPLLCVLMFDARLPLTYPTKLVEGLKHLAKFEK